MIRVAVLILFAGVVGGGERSMTVSDLVEMLTAKLAVDQDDHRIARELESIHLSERLEEATVDALKRLGAGRQTIHQLQALVRKANRLPRPSLGAISFDPAPAAADREAMSEAMRHYASQYLREMPNFLCTREARRFWRDLLWEHSDLPISLGWEVLWYLRGSYTAEAAYVDGADLLQADSR